MRYPEVVAISEHLYEKNILTVDAKRNSTLQKGVNIFIKRFLAQVDYFPDSENSTGNAGQRGVPA